MGLLAFGKRQRLFDACARGDAGAVARLCEGEMPQAELGEALGQAARLGHLPIVEVLCRYVGAAAVSAGPDPFIEAYSAGNNHIVGFLVRNSRWSPADTVARVIRSGNAGLLRLMLECGLPPELTLPPPERLAYGITPLMLAARTGHPALVKILLEGGASRTRQDGAGRSVVWHARDAGALTDEMYALLVPASERARNARTARELVSIASEPGLPVEELNGVLTVVARGGDVVLARSLLERRGAYPGPECVDAAVSTGNPAMLDLILGRAAWLDAGISHLQKAGSLAAFLLLMERIAGSTTHCAAPPATDETRRIWDSLEPGVRVAAAARESGWNADVRSLFAEFLQGCRNALPMVRIEVSCTEECAPDVPHVAIREWHHADGFCLCDTGNTKVWFLDTGELLLMAVRLEAASRWWTSKRSTITMGQYISGPYPHDDGLLRCLTGLVRTAGPPLVRLIRGIDEPPPSKA